MKGLLANQADFSAVIQEIFQPIPGDNQVEDEGNDRRRLEVIQLAEKYIDKVTSLKESIHRNAVRQTKSIYSRSLPLTIV